MGRMHDVWYGAWASSRNIDAGGGHDVGHLSLDHWIADDGTSVMVAVSSIFASDQ